MGKTIQLHSGCYCECGQKPCDTHKVYHLNNKTYGCPDKAGEKCCWHDFSGPERGDEGKTCVTCYMSSFTHYERTGVNG